MVGSCTVSEIQFAWYIAHKVTGRFHPCAYHSEINKPLPLLCPAHTAVRVSSQVCSENIFWRKKKPFHGQLIKRGFVLINVHYNCVKTIRHFGPERGVG